MTRPSVHSTLRRVASAFGFTVRQITPLHSLYRKNVAFRVLTNKGPVMIKPFKSFTMRVQRAYCHIEKIKAAGFTSFPKWFTATNGKPIWVHRHVHYYATEWVAGRSLGETEHDLEQLGNVLGELHRISKQIENLSETVSHTANYIKKCKYLHQLFRLRLSKLQKRRDHIGLWFRHEGSHCIQLFKEAYNILDQPEVKELIRSGVGKNAIIHGDVTRPNIIFTPEKCYLIDCDRARKGSTNVELAKALVNITNFSIPQIEAFLRGYEQQCSLRREERLLISALVRFPQEAWDLAQPSWWSARNPNFNTLKKTWPDRISAIQWIDVWINSAGLVEPISESEPPPT